MIKQYDQHVWEWEPLMSIGITCTNLFKACRQFVLSVAQEQHFEVQYTVTVKNQFEALQKDGRTAS